MSGLDDSTIIVSKTGLEQAQAQTEVHRSTACFIGIGGELNHIVFELWPGLTTIGRSSKVTYCLEYESISRRHLAVEVDPLNGLATLTDLGSRNGTFLNNQKVDAPESLTKGDIVKLGEVVLQFIPPRDPERLTYDLISKQAHTDLLTGCFSRPYANQKIDGGVCYSNLFSKPLSLLLIEVDWIEKLKVSASDQGCDQFLKALAEVVRAQCVREGDIFGRLDNHEFVLIVPETDLLFATKLAEVVRKAVADCEFRYDFRKWSISISVGFCEVRNGIKTGRELFRCASQSLALAKARGRNRVESAQVTNA